MDPAADSEELIAQYARKYPAGRDGFLGGRIESFARIGEAGCRNPLRTNRCQVPSGTLTFLNSFGRFQYYLTAQLDDDFRARWT
jgi:hypothetical protein